MDESYNYPVRKVKRKKWGFNVSWMDANLIVIPFIFLGKIAIFVFAIWYAWKLLKLQKEKNSLLKDISEKLNKLDK